VRRLVLDLTDDEYKRLAKAAGLLPVSVYVLALALDHKNAAGLVDGRLADAGAVHG
jgi:hypothetical protein